MTKFEIAPILATQRRVQDHMTFRDAAEQRRFDACVPKLTQLRDAVKYGNHSSAKNCIDFLRESKFKFFEAPCYYYESRMAQSDNKLSPQDKMASARAKAEKSLEAARANQIYVQEQIALTQLARIELLDANLGTSIKYADSKMALADQHGDNYNRHIAQILYAAVSIFTGDYTKAEASLAAAKEYQNTKYNAIYTARLRLAQGRHKEAWSALAEILNDEVIKPDKIHEQRGLILAKLIASSSPKSSPVRLQYIHMIRDLVEDGKLPTLNEFSALYKVEELPYVLRELHVADDAQLPSAGKAAAGIVRRLEDMQRHRSKS